LTDLTLSEGLRDDDVAFVMDTWARSFQRAPSCETMPPDAYFPWQRKRMDTILAREPLVVVARGKDPLWLYGYGVFERIDDAFVAHWLYVKKHYKRQRVASRLLAHALEQIGHGATSLVLTHRTYIEPKALEMGFTHVRLDDLYRGET
jgi:ribosomal protein S18 acetylase RimI-like enzyme